MRQTTAISLEQIAETYRSEMTSRARRILSSDADAEDAVQETLLTILKSPHVLGGIERLGGWLLTLVTRRCIDIIRRETTRRNRESEVGLSDLFETEDPSTFIDRDEVAVAVADAVRDLAPPLRDAFVMNALEMKTFKEMSESTGIPMGTLMARKKKAVTKIRKALSRLGFDI